MSVILYWHLNYIVFFCKFSINSVKKLTKIYTKKSWTTVGSGTRNRLLDAKLDKNKTHFSIENITETLKNMEVVNVGDMYYMSTYNGSQICTALNTVFDLELDKKYYLPKELNKKIST